MKSITPYLNFDGQAREAMTLYQQFLGGELSMQEYDAAPAGAEGGHSRDPKRIIHARITLRGNAVLMASDTPPDMPPVQGNAVYVSVDCDSVDEQDRAFSGIGDGGTVLMPLQEMFWGARFGMLRDRYGVNWMFNCEKK